MASACAYLYLGDVAAEMLKKGPNNNKNNEAIAATETSNNEQGMQSSNNEGMQLSAPNGNDRLDSLDWTDEWRDVILDIVGTLSREEKEELWKFIVEAKEETKLSSSKKKLSKSIDPKMSVPDYNTTMKEIRKKLQQQYDGIVQGRGELTLLRQIQKHAREFISSLSRSWGTDDQIPPSPLGGLMKTFKAVSDENEKLEAAARAYTFLEVGVVLGHVTRATKAAREGDKSP